MNEYDTTSADDPAVRPPLLSDTFSPVASAMNRRSLLSVAGLGTSAAAVGMLYPHQARADSHLGIPADFDTMDPETNLRTLLKIQADLSGKDVIGGFPGKAWMWVPGEANYLAFQTYGIGATRLDYQGEGVWNFHHREVLYYMDPETGKVLDIFLV